MPNHQSTIVVIGEEWNLEKVHRFNEEILRSLVLAAFWFDLFIDHFFLFLICHFLWAFCFYSPLFRASNA